jgi:hypothetical protein
LITSGHLGAVTKEEHWVALIFDMTQPGGIIRYGDSFGAPIPTELLSACRWWLSQHTAAEIRLEDLPIGKQKDGFSCGMLVDNAHQHFVDPSVSLTAPGEYVDARLEIFNKACARSLEQVSRYLLTFHSNLLT